MNSITHAYSVIAFLLLLGSALIGYPLSAFSQTTTDSATATSTQAAEAATTSAPVDASITDSYPREKLPGNQVFHDFVVGPGRFDMQVAPGESKTVEMIITNRMGERKKFSLTTEDISGSSDGSQAVVLLGNQRGPYTLKDFIHVPNTQFYLNQGERVRIPVTITLPKDAEPGGYYGSLLASIASDPNEQNAVDGAKPGSVVVSHIGTLFFVTTPGALTQEGKLKSFSTVGGKTFFGKGPIQFSIVSENTGSVHLVPSGEVHIFNMFGSEVGAVKLDPWFVLPKSLRTREFTWNREFLMGRYTAVATIDRGYDKQTDEMSFSFYVIPWKLIGSAFVALFLFFLLLRFIFSQFEFKRRSK